MFLAIAVVAGLVIARLRGRSFERITNRHFRHLWVLGVAICLHLVLVPLLTPRALALALAVTPLPGLPALGGILYVASLCLVLAFLALNQSQPGFKLVLLGLLLNFLVIAANGGQMPGDPNQIARTGLLPGMLEAQRSGLWSTFTLMDSSTRFGLLGDWIFMPMPFREPVILSIGDLLIAVGALAFFNFEPRAPEARPA